MWNLGISPEAWGFHRVSLGLYHPDDSLLCPRVVGHALLGWSVPGDKHGKEESLPPSKR